MTSRAGSKSSGKKADRLPVWQRAPPAPRVAIPPAAIAAALAPGERPPFNTSFSGIEGPLSVQRRPPSGIREKGAGNPLSAASVAAVASPTGTPSPSATTGVHGRRASQLPSGAAAAVASVVSPSKRPSLARAQSVSSPAGVNVFTSSSSPLTTSSVKRPSTSSSSSASPNNTRIPLPKGVSPASGVSGAATYRPSLSVPRKGSGNKQQQSSPAPLQPSSNDITTPVRHSSQTSGGGGGGGHHDDESDESGNDVASPEMRRPEFGREEVKRMLAERRAEREAREREEAADFGALMSADEPPSSSSTSSSSKRGTTTSSSTSSRASGRTIDEKTWLAEQNRKLEEAQEERATREEDSERLRMERDARTREADEQYHQRVEEDDYIRQVMMNRLGQGTQYAMRSKLTSAWQTQLETEFAMRRRQAEEQAESKNEDERKKKELDDTKQRLLEDQIARADEVKRSSAEAELQRREAEEYAILARGMELTKVANKKLIGGSPKKCIVSLIRLAEPGSAGTATGPWAVRWESRKKKSLGEAMMLLEDCDLALGIQHGNFRKEKTAKQFAEFESLAFSLLSSKRSLDLVCAKKDDFDLWIRVLKRLPVCAVLHDRSELTAAAATVIITTDTKDNGISSINQPSAPATPQWPLHGPPSIAPPAIPSTPSSQLGTPLQLQIDPTNEPSHQSSSLAATSVAF